MAFIDRFIHHPTNAETDRRFLESAKYAAALVVAMSAIATLVLLLVYHPFLAGEGVLLALAWLFFLGADRTSED